jgi:hypothetical protein
VTFTPTTAVLIDLAAYAVVLTGLLIWAMRMAWNAESRRIFEEDEAQLAECTHPGRVVVCSANRYSNGLMLVGLRHWDTQMHHQAMAYKAQGVLPTDASPEQGFLDNNGVFLTRQEAWVVAVAAGQVVRRVGGDEGCLYSENLY